MTGSRRIKRIRSTSSSKTAATEPAITDHARYTEGEFTLISSDHVRFRIPLHHLMSACPVFVDASTLPGDGERSVQFLDDKIETAAVLELFFKIILDGSIVDIDNRELDYVETDDLEVENTTSLIFFLRKYDCKKWLHITMMSLQDASTYGQVAPWVYFVTACVAEYTMLVAKCLDQYRDDVWESSGVELNEDLSQVLDLRGFPYELWAMIPPRIAHAATKAMTLVEKMPEKKLKPGDIFLEILGERRYGDESPFESATS